MIVRAVLLAALAPPVGATMLLLFMRLVPGRWEVLRPAATTLARLAPLVAIVLAIAVLVALPDPGRDRFRAAWLAPPWFVVRSLLTAAVFAVLGWIAARGPVAAATAAAGLIALTLFGSSAGFDWIQASYPRFHSAQFGLQFVAHLWLGGVAAALLLTLYRSSAPPDPVAVGILVTALMIWAYFWAMAYVVAWSADLPEEAQWWLSRQVDIWGALLAALALLQFLIPFSVLLLPAARASRPVVATICAATLVFRVVEMLWLLLPPA